MGFEPTSPEGARFSRPARRAVSGYLPLISVDPPRVELGSPPRQGGVFPLDHEPFLCEWTRWELNPPHRPCKGQSPPTACRPAFPEVRPGIEPGLRPYQGGVLPEHLQTVASVIPDGIEPPISWMSPRRLGRWTTGSSSVTEAGIEPAKSRDSRPRRFACLRTRPRSSSGSGGRTRRSRLMGPG